MDCLCTLPSNLSIRRSSQTVGYGVWSLKEIPIMTRFGPYRGVFLEESTNIKSSGFQWKVQRKNMNIATLDGRNENKSNWLRYVNYARSKQEQNLIAIQRPSGVYYETCRTIPAQTQLLVWYQDTIHKFRAKCGEGSYESLGNDNRTSTDCKSDAGIPSVCDNESSDKGNVDNLQERTELSNNFNSWKCKVNCRERSKAVLCITRRILDKKRSAEKQKKHNMTTRNDKRVKRGRNNRTTNIRSIWSFKKPVICTKKYECHVCRKIFVHCKILKLHLRSHIDKKSRECGRDSATYKRKAELSVQRSLRCTENSYKCKMCGKGFRRSDELESHVNVHNSETICRSGTKPGFGENLKLRKSPRRNEQSFTRNVLGKRRARDGDLKLRTESRKQKRDRKEFEKPQAPLKIRKRIGAEKASYKCNVCKMKCKSKYILKYHKMNHRNKKPYECNECGMRFILKSRLKKHKTVHSDEKPFKCSECEMEFRWKSALKQHQSIHTGETSFKCDECGKEFRRSSGLKRHEIIHTGIKPYKCKKCGRRFAFRLYLRKHESVHTGVKPYECKTCGKKYAAKDNLKRHEAIHLDEKPFGCNECGRRFQWKYALKKHLLIHSDEKPFKCNVCGREFRIATSLKAHERIHSGIKPYKCKVCRKKFAHSIYLQLHERIHTGDKPYECKVCGKKFARIHYLTKHGWLHNGMKPYECNVCGKKFSQRIYLTKHTNTHKSEHA